MKKKILPVVLMIIAVLAVVIGVKGFENSKVSPEERDAGTESNSEGTGTDETDGTADEDTAEAVGAGDETVNDNGESGAEASAETEGQTADDDAYIIQKGNLSFRFISCEILEDTEIEDSGKYSTEYFYSGEFPDTEYTEEVIDREAVMEESPEMKKFWSEDSGYSTDEELSIYNENLDLIQKYTTYEHPETKYLFVKCEITNTSSNPLNDRVSLYTCNAASDGSEWAFHDNTRYFDKSEHLTGDDRTHDFFLYSFEAGETLECTLGFECRVEFGEDEVYYLGVLPAGVDVLDPETDSHFTRVDTLPHTDN